MSRNSRANLKSSYSRVSNCIPVQIDEKIKEELLGCLNIDEIDPQISSENIFSMIENILGTYKPAEKIFDHEPRSANIHAAIMPVRKNTEKLIWLLNDLNEVVAEQLKESGFDRSDDIDAIIRLHNAALKVEKKYKGVESRRARTKRALEIVIAELCSIFNKYYQSPGEDIDAVPDAGFIKGLTDKENGLREFVEYCLNVENIKHPKDLSPYLTK